MDELKPTPMGEEFYQDNYENLVHIRVMVFDDNGDWTHTLHGEADDWDGGKLALWCMTKPLVERGDAHRWEIQWWEREEKGQYPQPCSVMDEVTAIVSAAWTTPLV